MRILVLCVEISSRLQLSCHVVCRLPSLFVIDLIEWGASIILTSLITRVLYLKDCNVNVAAHTFDSDI